MRALLNDLPATSRQDLVELLEEATGVGAWDWDIANNTFLWSPRQFVHFGLEPLPLGAITYELWLQAIHPDDRGPVQSAIAHTIATAEPLDLTFRVLWRETDVSAKVDVHWLRSRGRLVRDEHGSPLRMVGTSRDVTAAEQERASLQAQRDASLTDRFAGPSRFDILVDSSEDCLVQLKVQPDGRFTYQMINPTGLKVLGMTMAAAHGLTPVEALGAENGGQMTSALQRVVETCLPFHYEPTFDYGQQAVVYDATYMPLFDDRGVVAAVLCCARNVTQERQLQVALQQAQKMEALGQMAAGITHDLNNLLTSLRACFIRLIRLSPSAEIDRIVGLGADALQQGEALTRSILQFARTDDGAVATASLNRCVQDTVPLLRSAVPEAVIATDMIDIPLDVIGDRSLIQACLLNLCINARDARPINCEITIETMSISSQDTPPRGLPAGNYAALRVRDNGPGMTAEVRTRALEPFFTTKPRGQGTGLGLSIVDRTVRSFGGIITIENREGGGAAVTLYFLRR